MRWADELIHHPRILDAVQHVNGPDILCWESVIFAEGPKTADYIAWHQDITYWGSGSDDVVTARVALSPSTVESGRMRVVPGTRTREVVPHRDTYAEQNLLSHGQEIVVEVGEEQGADTVLMPGQMSLHHVEIFHGSFKNRSDDRRIGFAIRYIPPHVRQVVGAADSTMAVRGRDPFGYFELERRPSADLDPDQLAHHARLRAQRMAIPMRPVQARRGRGRRRFTRNRRSVGARARGKRTRRLFGSDGADVPIGAMERELLEARAHRPGRVLSRGRLARLAHARAPGPADRPIELRITRLGCELEAGPASPRTIGTLCGRGCLDEPDAGGPGARRPGRAFGSRLSSRSAIRGRSRSGSSRAPRWCRGRCCRGRSRPWLGRSPA